MNLPIENLEHLSIQLREASEGIEKEYQERLRDELYAIETAVADWKWNYETFFSVLGVPVTPVAEKWMAVRHKLTEGPFKLPFCGEKLHFFAYSHTGNISIQMAQLSSESEAQEFNKLLLEISIAQAWQSREEAIATVKKGAKEVEQEVAFLTERANFFRRVEEIITHADSPPPSVSPRFSFMDMIKSGLLVKDEGGVAETKPKPKLGPNDRILAVYRPGRSVNDG